MMGANLNLTYQETTPGPIFRSYQLFGLGVLTTNFDGDLNANTLFAGSSWQLRNFWSANLNAGYTFAQWDDRLTRGGPMALRPADGRIFAGIASDGRKRVTAQVGSYYGFDAAGNSALASTLTLGIRPSPRWNLSVGPQLQRVHSMAQYLAAVPDSLAVATFGRRYVFAELDQHTLSLDARLNVTFTPALTLELFAQPFLSSVAFGAPGELRAPRTYEFLRYGEDAGTLRREGLRYRVDPDGDGPAAAFEVTDPDFNQRSLRGNAVLRWEWRPGSTLYFAWQQTREDQALLDDFAFGRDTRALFGAPAKNVFVVKLNYWLNL